MPPLRRRARTKFSDTNSSRSGSIPSRSRSATPNGRQTSLQHLYKRYPNLGKPLSQKEWAGCKCEGECRPSSCSCLRDGAPCRQSCCCGPACAHQFPACACKASNGCGRWCPCFLTHHQCNPGCPCPAGTCDVEEDLPKVEVEISTIKTAGFGLFAGEFIPKGRLIRRFEGEIVPTPSIEDWDLFDISKGKFPRFSCPKYLLTFPGGHSIQIAKEGAFYINEKPFSEANAEFRYMEGRRRREVVARAKRDILPGEEIFAQYSDGTHDPCFPLYDFRLGSYVLVKGKGETEPWVGKISRVGRDEESFTVDWLLREKDLHYLPASVRNGISLSEGELIMCKGWRDVVDYSSLIQVGYVYDAKPVGKLNTNLWWWTRVYDVRKGKMM